MDQQTKTALKQDKFVTTTSHGLAWANENRKSVIVTSSLLLGVILLVVLAGVLYTNRADAASVAFGAAMQAYQTPLAQPGQTVPPGVKTYPTAVDRAKAANALFLDVANRYSLAPDGKVARYFAGLTYIEAGQQQQAEDTLKKVAGGWNSDLSGLARLSLAQLYRDTGRDPQALDLYNQLIAKPTTTVPSGLAQIQKAELLQSEGKTAEAKAIYAKLKDSDPKGAAGMLASQKLNPTAPHPPQQQ